MTTNPVKLIIITAMMVLSVRSALAQSTAFTYQGRLDDAGVAAHGPHDLRFRLFDAAVGGVQIGQMQCSDNIVVGDGLFTVQLDFGQQYATAVPRHLEIEVRRDTGLNCANAGGFVVLSPRQPLTPTPLATHANAAFALDAADGSPANAVFVNFAGDVGIGTTTPQGKLDVRSGSGSWVLVDTIHGDLHANGGTDGVFGLWNDSSVGIARTDFILGGVARMVVNAAGVGIGTTDPTTKLDVRGNIRLGPTGQLYAASGEENLRTVRGVLTAEGAIITGSGFTVTHPGTGEYVISFNTAFAGPPTVTATADIGGATGIAFVMTNGVSVSTAHLAVINQLGVGGTYANLPVHFIAVGPR